MYRCQVVILFVWLTIPTLAGSCTCHAKQVVLVESRAKFIVTRFSYKIFLTTSTEQRLTVAQLVKQAPCFYRSRTFIYMFTYLILYITNHSWKIITEQTIYYECSITHRGLISSPGWNCSTVCKVSRRCQWMFSQSFWWYWYFNKDDFLNAHFYYFP